MKIYYFHHENEDDKDGNIYVTYQNAEIYNNAIVKINLIYIDTMHNPKIKPEDRLRNGHYVLVNNDTRLFEKSNSNHKGKMYYHDLCGLYFTTEELFNKHCKNCTEENHYIKE